MLTKLTLKELRKEFYENINKIHKQRGKDDELIIYADELDTILNNASAVKDLDSYNPLDTAENLLQQIRFAISKLDMIRVVPFEKVDIKQQADAAYEIARELEKRYSIEAQKTATSGLADDEKKHSDVAPKKSGGIVAKESGGILATLKRFATKKAKAPDEKKVSALPSITKLPDELLKQLEEYGRREVYVKYSVVDLEERYKFNTIPSPLVLESSQLKAVLSDLAKNILFFNQLKSQYPDQIDQINNLIKAAQGIHTSLENEILPAVLKNEKESEYVNAIKLGRRFIIGNIEDFKRTTLKASSITFRDDKTGEPTTVKVTGTTAKIYNGKKAAKGETVSAEDNYKYIADQCKTKLKEENLLSEHEILLRDKANYSEAEEIKICEDLDQIARNSISNAFAKAMYMSNGNPVLLEKFVKSIAPQTTHSKKVAVRVMEAKSAEYKEQELKPALLDHKTNIDRLKSSMETDYITISSHFKRELEEIYKFDLDLAKEEKISKIDNHLAELKKLSASTTIQMIPSLKKMCDDAITSGEQLRHQYNLCLAAKKRGFFTASAAEINRESVIAESQRRHSPTGRDR